MFYVLHVVVVQDGKGFVSLHATTNSLLTLCKSSCLCFPTPETAGLSVPMWERPISLCISLWLSAGGLCKSVAPAHVSGWLLEAGTGAGQPP